MTFDALYRASPDPWGTHTRWYERRKRELLIAALPKPHYDTAYEGGCGTGHLTKALASRCGRVLASDGSPEAVALAVAATRDCSNVIVAQHALPQDWPARPFELIVLSELIYFLETSQAAALAHAARSSAGPTGLVVACNWRAMIEGYGHRGDEAHERFAEALNLPRAFEYVDADFVLSGWSLDTTSVAERETLIAHPR